VRTDRRSFLRLLASAPGLGLLSCTDESRYSREDAAALEAQRRREQERSGKGPYGPQRYRGYRGLAELPWFELDASGRLRCVAEDLPPVLDIHAHLGMSLLFAPEVDLLARTPRVHHMLDCDRESPGCPLDLDVYINANFRPADLRELRQGAVAQLLWGSEAAQTQTIPNLLEEMDATRVEQALILPIAFGLPFGDDLTERWMAAIARHGSSDRLLKSIRATPRPRPSSADTPRGEPACSSCIPPHSASSPMRRSRCRSTRSAAGWGFPSCFMGAAPASSRATRGSSR